MSGHTPGPWRVNSNPTSNYGLEVVADNAIKAKRVVCRFGGPDREDNARLIAAAPNMLVVLQEISELDLKNTTSLSWDMILRIRDLIAKATDAVEHRSKSA